MMTYSSFKELAYCYDNGDRYLIVQPMHKCCYLDYTDKYIPETCYAVHLRDDDKGANESTIDYIKRVCSRTLRTHPLVDVGDTRDVRNALAMRSIHDRYIVLDRGTRTHYVTYDKPDDDALAFIISSKSRPPANLYLAAERAVRALYRKLDASSLEYMLTQPGTVDYYVQLSWNRESGFQLNKLHTDDSAYTILDSTREINSQISSILDIFFKIG